MLPVSGVGARISGSTPDGGHNTPSDFGSLSLSGSFDWPAVKPLGAFAPSEPVGSQRAEDCGGGGAVCCGGVTGVGGACAMASAETMSVRHKKTERLIGIRNKLAPSSTVPERTRFLMIVQLVRSQARIKKTLCPARRKGDRNAPAKNRQTCISSNQRQILNSAAFGWSQSAISDLRQPTDQLFPSSIIFCGMNLWGRSTHADRPLIVRDVVWKNLNSAGISDEKKSPELRRLLRESAHHF
jgi:hypothetical protein